MTRFFSAALMLAAALFVIGGPTTARSQVVVYKVNFEHVDGFNLEFFDGGYFVAPALGGSGTFVLTARVDGRKTVTSSAGTGSFFHGVDEGGKRMTVVSATGGDGSTSTSTYVAFGEVTGSVEIVTSLATYKVKVARKLEGQAIAVGDESGTTTTTTDSSSGDSTTDTTTTTTTDTTTSTTTTTSSSTTTSSTDGTVGFAHISKMTLNLDDGHTKAANEKELSVSDTAAALVTELKQKGYVDPSDTTTDSDTDTGNTTDTSTSTTTTTTN